MNIPEFVSAMRNRRLGASEQELSEFEALIGKGLPEEYRQFLAMANGGDVEDDRFFSGTDDAGITICGIGGLPELLENREDYQISEQRIPRELLWIMHDAFSRAVCVGLTGPYRGKLYLWDSDDEPGPSWDGKVESAGNIMLLANSFTEFIATLRPPPRQPRKSWWSGLFGH